MTAVSDPQPAPALATLLPPDDWERLVRDHQGTVWRYVRYLGAAATEADDLVQETFLALARSDFEQQSQPQTISYLRCVARNQLLMLRRRQRRELAITTLDEADAVWTELVGDNSAGPYLDALAECVDTLDGRARQAIDLHYHQRVGREAMAKQLDMKPEGVKTLLRRTRDILRACVQRRLKDD
jgi:RNA polymerase sigma-70 factor (ECF subfamily)